MSLQAAIGPPIPEATRRIARAARPKGTLCMRLADRRGTLYQDQQLAALLPQQDQPALSPARRAPAGWHECYSMRVRGDDLPKSEAGRLKNFARANTTLKPA